MLHREGAKPEHAPLVPHARCCRPSVMLSQQCGSCASIGSLEPSSIPNKEEGKASSRSGQAEQGQVVHLAETHRAINKSRFKGASWPSSVVARRRASAANKHGHAREELSKHSLRKHSQLTTAGRRPCRGGGSRQECAWGDEISKAAQRRHGVV